MATAGEATTAGESNISNRGGVVLDGANDLRAFMVLSLMKLT